MNNHLMFQQPLFSPATTVITLLKINAQEMKVTLPVMADKREMEYAIMNMQVQMIAVIVKLIGRNAIQLMETIRVMRILGDMYLMVTRWSFVNWKVTTKMVNVLTIGPKRSPVKQQPLLSPATTAVGSRLWTVLR